MAFSEANLKPFVLVCHRFRLLDMEYWQRAGGVQTWREMHATMEVGPQVQLLRRCTYAGRRFGEEEFVERLEARVQPLRMRWGLETRVGA